MPAARLRAVDPGAAIRRWNGFRIFASRTASACDCEPAPGRITRRATALGRRGAAEGVGLPYVSARTRNWLKLKNRCSSEIRIRRQYAFQS
jgi:hypothetical protein